MTLEYIKAKPQVNAITRRVETRTLELDATQVEGIVRLWARAHANFTNPEVETSCSWDGMILTEETTQTYDDRDTPIEGD